MPDGKDIDFSDHLVNLHFKTALGNLTAYAYLREDDENIMGKPVPENSLDMTREKNDYTM